MTPEEWKMRVGDLHNNPDEEKKQYLIWLWKWMP